MSDIPLRYNWYTYPETERGGTVCTERGGNSTLNPQSAADVLEVLQARIIELENALRSARELSPRLLLMYGYVPGCVLEFLNRAREVLK